MEPEARGSAMRRRGPLLAALQLLLLLQVTARSAAGLKLQPPRGTAGGQVVIDEGSTLLLSCEDADDIRLMPPPFSALVPSIPEIVQRRQGQLWNLTLTLRDARPAHSGFYNCSSIPNRRDSEGVYVYVRSKSKDRPWVLDSDDMRQRQMAEQYSAHLHGTATLDCRPNDPTTIVRLRDGKNRTLALGRQPDGTELRWDPRAGFSLGPVALSHSGTYWCAAQGSARELQLKLQVVGVELVAPLVWLNRDAPSVPRGADVTLSCELAMVRRRDFNLTWAAPAGRLNEGFRWVAYGAANDSHAWQRKTKLLYVFNAKDGDAGDYICTASDAAGNRKSATLRLQVQGGAPPPQEATKPAAPTAAHAPQAKPAKGAKSAARRSGARAALVVSAALCLLSTPVARTLRGCS